MSPVSATSRWTPPMPPVAKTATPAAAARESAPDTVVAPVGQPPATATGMSRAPSFSSASSTRSQLDLVHADPGLARRTTVIAGTAPAGADGGQQASRHSRLTGGGRPNSLKIVDSSATTGRRSASATGDLLVDPDHVMAGSHASPPGPRRTWAATSLPRATHSTGGLPAVHATRNPAAKASPAPVVSTTPVTGGDRHLGHAVGRDQAHGVRAVLLDDQADAGRRSVRDPQHPGLVGVGEEDGRLQVGEQRQEAVDAVLHEERLRGRVEGHRDAPLTGHGRQRQAGAGQALHEQRVGGQVEDVDAVQPLGLGGGQLGGRGPVGEHRPLARRVDQHDDRPGPPAVAGDHVDPGHGQAVEQPVGQLVVAQLAHEAGRAHRPGPRRRPRWRPSRPARG